MYHDHVIIHNTKINFKFQAQMEFKFNAYIDTETVYSPSLITEQTITCSEKLSIFNVHC